MLMSLVSDEDLSNYSVVGAHVVATDDLILQSLGMSSISPTSLTEDHEVADFWHHCGPCHYRHRFTNFSCVTPR